MFAHHEQDTNISLLQEESLLLKKQLEILDKEKTFWINQSLKLTEENNLLTERNVLSEASSQHAADNNQWLVGVMQLVEERYQQLNAENQRMSILLEEHFIREKERKLAECENVFKNYLNITQQDQKISTIEKELLDFQQRSLAANAQINHDMTETNKKIVDEFARVKELITALDQSAQYQEFTEAFRKEILSMVTEEHRYIDVELSALKQQQANLSDKVGPMYGKYEVKIQKKLAKREIYENDYTKAFFLAFLTDCAAEFGGLFSQYTRAFRLSESLGPEFAKGVSTVAVNFGCDFLPMFSNTASSIGELISGKIIDTVVENKKYKKIDKGAHSLIFEKAATKLAKMLAIKLTQYYRDRTNYFQREVEITKIEKEAKKIVKQLHENYILEGGLMKYRELSLEQQANILLSKIKKMELIPDLEEYPEIALEQQNVVKTVSVTNSKQYLSLRGHAADAENQSKQTQAYTRTHIERMKKEIAESKEKLIGLQQEIVQLKKLSANSRKRQQELEKQNQYYKEQIEKMTLTIEMLGSKVETLCAIVEKMQSDRELEDSRQYHQDKLSHAQIPSKVKSSKPVSPSSSLLAKLEFKIDNTTKDLGDLQQAIANGEDIEQHCVSKLAESCLSKSAPNSSTLDSKPLPIRKTRSVSFNMKFTEKKPEELNPRGSLPVAQATSAPIAIPQNKSRRLSFSSMFKSSPSPSPAPSPSPTQKEDAKQKRWSKQFSSSSSSP